MAAMISVFLTLIQRKSEGQCGYGLKVASIVVNVFTFDWRYTSKLIFLVESNTRYQQMCYCDIVQSICR